MNILIFRTNISNQISENSLKDIFEPHPGILKWTVDMEDVDRVLRVEALENMQETEVISLVTQQGVFCESLPG